MKTFQSLYFIFCCFSLVYLSCEKTEYRYDVKSNDIIEPRIDDCEECPVEDCCCGVQLLSLNETDLILCGTSSPDVTDIECGPYSVGSCEISGFELPINLGDQFDKGLFCMPQGAGFSITSSVPSVLRVSCQNGITNPWYNDVTISSSGGTVYLTNNGSCQVGPCSH